MSAVIDCPTCNFFQLDILALRTTLILQCMEIGAGLWECGGRVGWSVVGGWWEGDRMVVGGWREGGWRVVGGW